MNPAEIEVRSLTGPALEAALDDVARLRIAVFRDWPYLYDGTLEYERAYLATCATTPVRFWSAPFTRAGWLAPRPRP